MDESPEMPQPDKYRFVGSVKDPQKIEGARQYLEIGKVEMPPEQEKSSEREKQLLGIKAALLEFTESELKIDVSKRIPENDNFHFLDKSGYQDFRIMHSLDPRSAGVHTTNGHMIIQEHSKVEDALGIAQHELVHVVSSTTIDLCEVDGALQVGSGHTGYVNRKNQALAMVDEALTEMTNVEVMIKYWGNQESLREVSIENYQNISYIEQVIIMDELIKRVAIKNGQDAQDVLRELQRGKILGEMQSLRILTDEIGKDGMKMLANWTISEDQSDKIIEALGLEGARIKIEALRKGSEVKVMEYISPNIRQGASVEKMMLIWHKSHQHA